MKDKLTLLRKIPIFNRLKEGDLRKIAEIVEERAFKKGEVLFAAGSRGDTLYLIGKGKVKIYKEMATPFAGGGETKIFEILSEGEFLGEMALLNHEPRCASAMAIDDSWIYLIQKQSFNEVILNSPAIALNILEIISKRLRDADAHIQDITFRNIPGRLATLLMRLADKFGRKMPDGGELIDVRMTQQEIAQTVGTSRVYTSRYLNEFKREGSVAISGGRIVILDRAKLKTWM